MSESIWKKEIHLRKPKRPKEEQVEQVAAQPEPATSFWKKERSLRRRPEPLPSLPAHLLDRPRAREDRPRGTVVVPVVPAQSDPIQRVERWTARVPASRTEFLRPSAAGEGQDPVAMLPRERATVDPAPNTPPPLPVAASVYGWAREQAEPKSDVPAPPEPPAAPRPSIYSWTKSESAPEPVAETPVVADASESAHPGPAFSWLQPESSVEPPPEVTAESESVSDTGVSDTDLSPATLVEPEVHTEPVSEKVPLLKREISFKRKPKEPKPKQAKAPKRETAVVSEEKVPLLKREISFKRKAKRPSAEKPAPAVDMPDTLAIPAGAAVPETREPEPAPAAEKIPLLKREIKLSRAKHKSSAKPAGGGAHKTTRVVGLRIGSTQIAAAHIRNNGSAEVVQLARAPLDRGLIVGGEVREPEALAKALKAFFATHKLPKKDIRLGVASNRIGVRVLDVPAVDDPKHFENAIRFRAQELLPIPVADAVLDHLVVGEEVVGDGESIRRVLLVFAHRELVSRYVDVCRQAGLRLAGIDLDAFALLRAIGPQAESEHRRASVAVAVGHERTVFAVSDGELCEFTRVLEWGSNAIDVGIARALNLTPSQAEPIKVALDLDASEPPAGLSPMQFEVARSAVTAEIGHLVRELLSSLRFYQSLPDSLDLREVVLSGGGAELPGFAAEVQRGLGVPVRVGDPFERVSFAKRVNAPERAGSYAVAVGLGING